MKELIKPNCDEKCYEEIEAHTESADCCFAYVCNKYCMGAGRDTNRSTSDGDNDILF